MTLRKLCVLMSAGSALLALGACNKTAAVTNSTTDAAGNAAAPSDSDPTASAQSAAPAAISAGASVVQAAADGSMTTLRKGTNGWTCMPDSPATPGPDPMCFDASAGKWIAAWVAHKPPPDGVVGIIYMLAGGTDASNTDPYATKPTAENNWVKTGPHVMIVGSKEALAGHPSGATPETAAPYVMWSGTPYAHLMIPVAQTKPRW